jgi:hypothetical protein
MIQAFVAGPDTREIGGHSVAPTVAALVAEVGRPSMITPLVLNHGLGAHVILGLLPDQGADVDVHVGRVWIRGRLPCGRSLACACRARRLHSSRLGRFRRPAGPSFKTRPLLDADILAVRHPDPRRGGHPFARHRWC